MLPSNFYVIYRYVHILLFQKTKIFVIENYFVLQYQKILHITCKQKFNQSLQIYHSTLHQIYIYYKINQISIISFIISMSNYFQFSFLLFNRDNSFSLRLRKFFKFPVFVMLSILKPPQSRVPSKLCGLENISRDHKTVNFQFTLSQVK